MNVKRSVLVGISTAAVVLGAGGVGLASAATTDTNGNHTSMADKIASKFNLNKADVQAVFDQNRAEHRAQMEANFKNRLAQAVKDGKLTQAQSDHITSVLAEIDALRANTPPDQLSDTLRQQIRNKIDALRQWAKDNNIDMSLLGPAGHHRGGLGGADGSNNAPAADG